VSKSSKELLRSLISEGWCVIEGVIPVEVVPGIRQAVLKLVEAQRVERERWLAESRGQGQRHGADGVENAQGIINNIPECASFIADRRIIDVVEAIFGPYVKVSSTSAIVTNPNNKRGYWHADWPFNQTFTSHIPAPYGDYLIHLSSLFMLTDFSAENGGTLIVPGSQKLPDNPSGDNGIDCEAPHPNEINVTGKAGSVFLYDSRLWHSIAPNRSSQPRVAISVRYAPWWLNLEVRRKGSPDNLRIAVETHGKDNSVPLLSKHSFDALPEEVKPLFRHWVEN
jgi:ectoine hydroxylase-related dioxygenase (phytanoyl-CoA dioxygenase family)